MKVAMTAEAKRFITLEEAPIARQMIKDMKEDDGLKEYAEMAARVAGGNDSYEILKVSAEIAKNNRVYNSYSEDSKNLDIWLKAYAFNAYKGFYEIGIYLSDVWSITGDNSEEIRSRMYIEHYSRDKA
jgi:hypothetical protein